jgi:hypothetical protein
MEGILVEVVSMKLGTIFFELFNKPRKIIANQTVAQNAQISLKMGHVTKIYLILTF